MSIVEYIKQPNLSKLIQCFLHFHLSSNSNCSSSDLSADSDTLPAFSNKISLHSSATSIYFAPRDPCSVHGLRQEQIWATWSWRGGSGRQDTVLVDTGNGGNEKLPMSSYIVSHILIFFSFKYASEDFPIVLVWWYILSDDAGCRDKATGMWLIEHEFHGEEPHLVVVHIGSIFCTVHLLPFF
jgi:hypothetical protein